jgi:diguanylate cyclase (GGDEF)-like protein
MPDSRIDYFRRILSQLPNGETHVQLPEGPADEVNALGVTIAELAARLAERFERERLLARVTEQIVQGMYLEEVLDFVYESFRPLIPYDRMGCALLERGGDWVRACWTRSDSPDAHLREGFSAPMEGSSLRDIIETGKPRIINDLRRYLRDHPQSVATSLIVAEGVRSSLTCPLIALGKPVGFLFFSSQRPQCYEALHQDVFLRLSGLVSAVVEKSRLYQELMQLNQELTAARDELRVQATHDALTGIWNRGALIETYGKSFDQALRQRSALSVVLVDIDWFKQVNDTYGHQAGDAVIKAVAECIEKVVRHGDYVGRYGGEEFMMVLHDCNSVGAASSAERIRLAVREHPVVGPAKTLQGSWALRFLPKSR